MEEKSADIHQEKKRSRYCRSQVLAIGGDFI